jgi:hypothetical protein
MMIARAIFSPSKLSGEKLSCTESSALVDAIARKSSYSRKNQNFRTNYTFLFLGINLIGFYDLMPEPKLGLRSKWICCGPWTVGCGRLSAVNDTY